MALAAAVYCGCHTRLRLLQPHSVLTHGFNIVRALVHGNNSVWCVELRIAEVQNFQQVGLGDDHVFGPEIQVQDVVCMEVLNGSEDLP